MVDIDVPSAWRESAETITQKGWRTILLLGSVDRGKSTYCRFLGRHLKETGARVAIVDADIGQKDIGPPAAITLAYPDGSADLSKARPAGFYFVGSVSPARHLLPMVVGVKKLVEAARAPYIIINTTGMVHGLGRVLKSYKIEAVQPHVIVAIQKSAELKTLLGAYRNRNIIEIPPSPKAVPKNFEERKAARQKAFARYFSHASEFSVPFRSLIFQRSLLFNGRAVPHPHFIYCEETSEGTLAISNRPDPRGADLKVISPGYATNLLCGVVDGQNLGVGIAIVKEMNFVSRIITLITPVPPEKTKILQFGDLYVTSDGIELERKRPDLF